MSIDKRTLQAGLAMLGTIIGAGVFAIPSVFHTYGIPWGSVIFWSIAVLILITHLLLAEVVLMTRSQLGRKRLPGLVTEILGPIWGKIAFLSHPAQILGACLAYVILGGEFLAGAGLGYSQNLLFWQVIFWIGGAVTVLYGLKMVAKVESFLTWLLIATLIICAAIFSSSANPDLFFEATMSRSFAPLGILIFSLFGMTVIPELVQMTGDHRDRSWAAIIAGTLGAAILMWLFGVFAYAAAPAASVDPGQYAQILPAGFRWLIPVVGFLAVFTSFITLMEALKHMLIYDAKLKPQAAWSIALMSPLVLLLIMHRDFLGTISLVGGVFSAINGIFACALGVVILKRRWPLIPGGIFLLILLSRILSLI